MHSSTFLAVTVLSTFAKGSLHNLISRHDIPNAKRSMSGQKIFPPKFVPSNFPISPARPPASSILIDTTTTKRTATLELDMWPIFGLPFYTTNIALGNPSQPFRAMLDLGWDGLLVRSMDCVDLTCGDPTFTYNHSASGTYRTAHEKLHIQLPAHNAYGNVSFDDLFLISAKVPGAVFGKVDQFYGENFLLMILTDVCDGALGLGRPNATAYSHPRNWDKAGKPHPNILHQIIASEALERNTMFFNLPAQHGQLGKLVLGEELPKVDTVIPLTNRYDNWSGNSWNAELTNLVIRGNPAANYSFSPYSIYASFELTPFINLPDDLAQQIWKDLGAKQSDMVDGANVDCKTRDELPDLVFTLGGQRVVFTNREYSAHAYYGENQEICWIMIIGNEWGGDKMVHLGLAMLKDWDFWIDVDGNELGLVRKN